MTQEEFDTHTKKFNKGMIKIQIKYYDFMSEQISEDGNQEIHYYYGILFIPDSEPKLEFKGFVPENIKTEINDLFTECFFQS